MHNFGNGIPYRISVGNYDICNNISYGISIGNYDICNILKNIPTSDKEILEYVNEYIRSDHYGCNVMKNCMGFRDNIIDDIIYNIEQFTGCNLIRLDEYTSNGSPYQWFIGWISDKNDEGIISVIDEQQLLEIKDKLKNWFPNVPCGFYIISHHT